MSKINARDPMWQNARCQGCGIDTDVKFFEFATAPYEGASKNIHIYCQACASQVGTYLQNAWVKKPCDCQPEEEVPTWLKQMNKLSSRWHPSYEEGEDNV